MATTGDANGASSSMPDLSSIFTHKLFTDIYDLYLPWPANEEPSPATVRELYYSPLSALPESLAKLVVPTVYKPFDEQKDHLAPLLASLATSPNPPTFKEIKDLDLLHYLPTPTDPSFPRQALGFVLLLGSVPRYLIDLASSTDLNINIQDLNTTILSPLLRLLTHALYTLPPPQQPFSPTHFPPSSQTFTHTSLIRLHFHTSLTYSPCYADHLLAAGEYELLRRDIETHYEVKDPTRKSDASIAGDDEAEAKFLKQGPPPCGGKEMHTFLYWSMMVGRSRGAGVRAGILGLGEKKDDGKKVQNKYSACG